MSVEVSATTPSPLHELLLNRQVFTRGEMLNITVRANVATVQVLVYSSDSLFLSYNQAANTSSTFLVDEDWGFGFWNVTANFGNVQTGSFFTVLNDGDFVNDLSPYGQVRLGINYTVISEGVNATLLSTNRTLALSYPTITSLNQIETCKKNQANIEFNKVP